jgi:cation-transporting P-type ATPase 13A2
LKTAHIGIALSDSEASIVAPFTSAKQIVSDIPQLIAEGRCALETSFIAFKVKSQFIFELNQT